MKNIKIPGWVGALIIGGLISGLVFGTYWHEKTKFQSDCIKLADSEFYSQDGGGIITVVTRYCKKENDYSTQVRMPSGDSLLGPTLGESVFLVFKDKDMASRRAPYVSLNWSDPGRVQIKHEAGVEVDHDTIEHPTVFVELKPINEDWYPRHRRRRNDKEDYKVTAINGSLEQMQKDLKKLDISGTVGVIYYNPKITKVIDQSRDGASRALETRLDQKSKDVYVVDFSEGMSMDPGFMVHRRTAKGLESVGSFAGEQLTIPGNGAVYVVNSYNTTFANKNKYVLKNNELEYVKQPFKYVGLKTKATAVIRLYKSKEMKEEVAVLTRGAELFVLLADGENYLVRTPFGLLGWIHIERGYSSPIAGLYFQGD